jgi:hypothetical protein
MNSLSHLEFVSFRKKRVYRIFSQQSNEERKGSFQFLIFFLDYYREIWVLTAFSE